jgi:peptide/nickel transport system ATP-binding protein/oligopeptide transport system ATP-binding protein
MTKPKLLKVKDLKTWFHTKRGVIKAVDGISFSLRNEDTLGILGESGCGKSVTALSIMRLVSIPPGKIESGEILFEGRNILKFSKAQMKKIRGNKISMIFQEPMTSLNPVFRVGEQVAEAIRLHQGFSRKEAFNKSIEMLGLVGLPSPEKRVRDYPHQMSGGMRQRVMIAMAVSCRPKIIIADEPTTALDVTIQAQILDLVKKLKEEIGTSIILITHDMGVIAEMAQNVAVMYAGKIMERSSAEDLFENPRHPYTKKLLKSVPSLDLREKRGNLTVIPGTVPSLLNLPPGCSFNERCDRAMPKCSKQEPPLFKAGLKHTCRCWLYG